MKNPRAMNIKLAVKIKANSLPGKPTTPLKVTSDLLTVSAISCYSVAMLPETITF